MRELREHIPDVARTTVAAVAAQVPEYAPASRDPYKTELEQGVQQAFEGFARLLIDPDDRSEHLIRRGAQALGRTEARRRRGIAALLTAYQIGTWLHWEEVSAMARRHHLDADTVSDIAGLIFSYNQALTQASVEGYSAESRTRERTRELLAGALLAGTATDGLMQRAAWVAPQTLTCVLLSPRWVGVLLAAYPESLQSPVDDVIAVLVPDASRPALLSALRGTDAIVGPTRDPQLATHSYNRARAVSKLVADRPLDTDAHLAELILSDAAVADLREDVLAPLAGNPRLQQTLRSWLLHLGKREAVARELRVHPQTVRYRMQQIRETYGDRLEDPDEVLRLVLALGVIGEPTVP